MWSWLDPQERRAVAADRWLARLHRDGSPDTMARYRAWRARDPRHVQAIATSERVWRSMGKLSPELLARLRAETGADRPASFRKLPTAIMALAAALLLIVGSAILFRFVRPGPATDNGVSIVAARGGARLFPLPDGSSVTIDRGGAIQLAFAPSSRTVYLLQGRVRFSVVHDTARPFIVLAGDRRITAVGTVFEVTRGSNMVGVSMLQGIVDVTRADDHAPPVRLMRGQGLVATGTRDDVGVADPAAGQWGGDLDRLDGVTLGALLARANRHGGKPILLADPALKPAQVQGQLAIGDTRALANQLAAALDLELVEEPSGYVLRPRR